jgi:hypothetical protein
MRGPPVREAAGPVMQWEGWNAFFSLLVVFCMVMDLNKRPFPTFAVLILVLGLIWLAVELRLIAISVPWLPLIVVVLAAGWIVNHYQKG